MRTAEEPDRGSERSASERDALLSPKASVPQPRTHSRSNTPTSPLDLERGPSSPAESEEDVKIPLRINPRTLAFTDDEAESAYAKEKVAKQHNSSLWIGFGVFAFAVHALLVRPLAYGLDVYSPWTAAYFVTAAWLVSWWRINETNSCLCPERAECFAAPAFLLGELVMADYAVHDRPELPTVICLCVVMINLVSPAPFLAAFASSLMFLASGVVLVWFAEQSWMSLYIAVLASLFACYGGYYKEKTDRETFMMQYQLQRARERARIPIATKNEFLNAVSHEFRTPLNSINGFADLLLAATGLTAEQRQYLENIQMSAQQLTIKLADVFLQAEIRQKSIKLAPEAFELPRLLDKVIEDVKRMQPVKNVKITCTIPASNELPLVVVADSKRLGQVITRLLENAVKFTVQGEVNIAVSVHETVPPTDDKLTEKMLPPLGAGERWLRVEVKDPGCGMSEQTMKTIFRNFTQGDASYARPAEGMGLGLSICKALVRIMNGDIAVESKESSGSRFWFYVPVETVSEAELVETQSLKAIMESAYNKKLASELSLQSSDEKATSLAVAKPAPAAVSGGAAADGVKKALRSLFCIPSQHPVPLFREHMHQLAKLLAEAGECKIYDSIGFAELEEMVETAVSEAENYFAQIIFMPQDTSPLYVDYVSSRIASYNIKLSVMRLPGMTSKHDRSSATGSADNFDTVSRTSADSSRLPTGSPTSRHPAASPTVRVRQSPLGRRTPKTPRPNLTTSRSSPIATTTSARKVLFSASPKRASSPAKLSHGPAVLAATADNGPDDEDEKQSATEYARYSSSYQQDSRVASVLTIVELARQDLQHLEAKLAEAFDEEERNVYREQIDQKLALMTQYSEFMQPGPLDTAQQQQQQQQRPLPLSSTRGSVASGGGGSVGGGGVDAGDGQREPSPASSGAWPQSHAGEGVMLRRASWESEEVAGPATGGENRRQSVSSALFSTSATSQMMEDELLLEEGGDGARRPHLSPQRERMTRTQEIIEGDAASDSDDSYALLPATSKTLEKIAKGAIKKSESLGLPKVTYAPLNVVIVEDNALNQRLMNRMIHQRLGHNVHICNNGQECLDYLAKCAPEQVHAILMDIHMPVMDGIETTIRIRQMPHPYWQQLQIFAVTASATVETRHKAYMAGMNAFLTKPVQLNTLSRKLRVVQKEIARRPLAGAADRVQAAETSSERVATPPPLDVPVNTDSDIPASTAVESGARQRRHSLPRVSPTKLTTSEAAKTVTRTPSTRRRREVQSPNDMDFSSP